MHIDWDRLKTSLLLFGAVNNKLPYFIHAFECMDEISALAADWTVGVGGSA